MNAQDLKNSILQLAIQGKLVEQRKEEGTAKELIKQIEAEKKQLIKEGKIKKQKELPEIKEDEIPFDIPESWEWVRLGDTLDIARGGSPRPIKAFITDSEDGVNWIKIGDTDKGGKYINSTNEKIIKEGMKKSRFVKKGDFLLSNSMSFGRPYILNIEGCIHDGWLVLSQVVEVFNKDFLYYLLSSSMVFNQFQSIVSGAVVNNLNSEKVRITIVPLPPLEEQKRIVAKIEELMPYVDKYDVAYSEVEKLNKKFPEDIQKSILQYAIRGKLVEQREEDGTAEDLYKQIQEEKKKLIREGKIKKSNPLPEITEDEIPFDIPENWKWVRIADMSLFQEGPGIMAKDFRNSGIPLIRIAGMQGDNLSLDGCNYLDSDMVDKKWSHFKLDLGDVVISTSASMDKICEVTEDTVGAIPYTGQIRFKMYGNISKEYFKYFIMSNAYINQINEQKSGGTIKHYGPTHLKRMIIPLPPLAEQKRIIERIEELLPYTKQLAKKPD